jgi:hypothetical protein
MNSLRTRSRLEHKLADALAILKFNEQWVAHNIVERETRDVVRVLCTRAIDLLKQGASI